MKNKFIIFYTVFASAIFAFAIAFFGVNIYKEYSQGQARANQRYNTLITDIKAYNSIDKNISETSLSNIKSVLKDFNDFSFIQIKLNDSEILKYPKDVSAELTVSNLTKTFSSNFNTQNGQFEILCNLYLLRPSSIYYYAKISFIIILIVTLITIILIFYINSQEKQFSAKVSSEADAELLNENDFDSKLQLDENLSGSSSEVESSSIQQNSVNSIDLDIDLSSESEQNKKSFDEDSEQIFDLENNTEMDTEIQQSDSEYSSLNPEDKNNEDSQTEIPASLPDYESPVIIESSDVKENNDAENAPASDSSESNPSGLFNPVTGLGWESYLDTRLENEINRAISSEIDISVFIINIPNLERESEESKKVSEYLSLQFQFKDLLFEYKNDCIVAIKISMNLDDALNFADKIHAEIMQIINQKECYIGISTRSIRIVSSERLLNEAWAALEHAKQEEDSPIIAFRVDADKYRQFLEQN